jgi:hypothetical protein
MSVKENRYIHLGNEATITRRVTLLVFSTTAENRVSNGYETCFVSQIIEILMTSYSQI